MNKRVCLLSLSLSLCLSLCVSLRYQRTCSVFASECVAPDAKTGANKAPVHVVMGHAGAGLCTNIERERPAFFASVEVEHG